MTVLEEPPRTCSECGCWEHEHQYTPPGYWSDDGLPVFDGCTGKGYESYDEDYPVYKCKCRGWDHPDDD